MESIHIGWDVISGLLITILGKLLWDERQSNIKKHEKHAKAIDALVTRYSETMDLINDKYVSRREHDEWRLGLDQRLDVFNKEIERLRDKR